MEDRRTRRGLSDYEIKTMDMVAAYMLLANNCVAEFFNASNLPFIYRNFDEANDSHASYGTEALGHTAIRSMGIVGAYCHVTSPIRRAPDYFNEAMMHYVVDVLAQIGQQMQRLYPTVDPQKLDECLWQHGAEIMRLISSVETSRTNLIALLYKIAKEASPKNNQPERARTSVMNELRLPAMPFSKSDLDAYATHINDLIHAPEMVKIAKDNAKRETHWLRLNNIESKSRESLAALPSTDFSALLNAATMTGEMPDNLFNETLSRISSKNPNRIDDLFSVFIQAQYPASERWKALKRVAANEIKKDPGAVNALLYRLSNHIEHAAVQDYLDVIETRNGKQLPERIYRSLFVLEPEDGTKLAAPFFSVGHDDRAARSHACYSFLEHYAFGQLQPVEQTATPNLLYAKLDMPGTKKRALMEDMVMNAGADIAMQTKKDRISGYHTTITISGGDIPVPIIRTGKGETEEAATHSAIGHMLRNDAFRIAMSRHEAIGQDLLNPQTVLEHELAMHDGNVEFAITPAGSGFRAVATVHLHDTQIAFTAVEPNKDRARRVAAMEALISLGSEMPSPAHVASWASQINQADNEWV